MTLTIRDLPSSLGAEVTGVQLGSLTDDEFARIKHAFEQRSVIVVRDQHITPEEHIAFSRRFGPLEIHIQHHFHLAGHPEILVVSNETKPDGNPLGLADAGKYWHSDLSYMAEPSLGSALYAQTLPAEGGDTLFVDMAAAYDALEDETKRQIETLTAVHSYAARNRVQRDKSTLRPDLTPEQLARVPEVVHPVVRIHPATHRRALFVNEGFTTRIVELPEDESAALLQRLFAHMVQDRFTYRQKWQEHDLVMWDNRAAIHLATGCPPQFARTLYRTTIRGDVPIGPAGAIAA